MAPAPPASFGTSRSKSNHSRFQPRAKSPKLESRSATLTCRRAKHLIDRLMRSMPMLSILIATACSLLAADQDDPRFEKLMERSRKIYETNHMVVDVRLSSYDNKIPPAECHYDRYPGKVERIQLPKGGSFARKVAGKWLHSEDWGESGKAVQADLPDMLE